MSDIRERIAAVLWEESGGLPEWDAVPADRRIHSGAYDMADAVIAALGLREVHDGEGHYWQTPWERTEEDG